MRRSGRRDAEESVMRGSGRRDAEGERYAGIQYMG